MDKLIKPYPIAHRGCFDAAPENTLPAFVEAVKCGMQGVEIDIRKTKDGHIVVFHDDTPERLTIGYSEPYINRKISDLTLEEVKQIRLPYAGHLLRYFPEGGFENELHYYYPWEVASISEILAWDKKNGSVKDLKELLCSYEKQYQEAFRKDQRTEQILTLEEFLLWLKQQPEGFFAEIEYKDSDMTSQVVELMERTETTKRCILFSGVKKYNDEIQEWFKRNGQPKEIRLGANIRFYNEEILEDIKDYSLYEVGLNAGMFGEEEVKMLNERGIQVFSNLGDYPKWWEQMQHIGVAGFKTNTGKIYKEWKSERDSMHDNVKN